MKVWRGAGVETRGEEKNKWREKVAGKTLERGGGILT